MSTTRLNGGFVIMSVMANDNFNAGFGAGKPIGTGEGESPMVANPGSSPNVGIRTMSSDLGAVKAGETPKPYTPTTPTPAPGVSPVPPAGMATKDIGGAPSSFDLPQMDFGPTTPPTIGVPGSGIGSPSPMPAPKKKGGKGLFVGIITVIIVVGLAVLGYFVIYPMFFAAPTFQPSASTQTPSETASVPANPATSTENQAVASTSSAAATTTTPSVPAHVSLFKTPPEGTLTTATVTTGSGLSNLNISTAGGPKLVEIAYADQGGNPIGFANIAQTVFGLDFSSSSVLGSAWNDQGTAGFAYVDASGTPWLGFVTSINSSSSLAAVKAAFAQSFEANGNWSGAFASDPGTPGSWKSGTTDGIANRYLTFGSGASLNYGWSGNDLVISTSYAGFKDALSKL